MAAPPSTPPMTAVERPKTPPSPSHGAFLEHYEPYLNSPTATAVKSFASSNTGESSGSLTSGTEALTPRRQVTGRKGRTAHLASPPSSPVRRSPRKPAGDVPFTLSTPRRANNGANLLTHTTANSGNATSSLSTTAHDPASMMPTPSKTPSKKHTKRHTSRILNFQPESANDLMPKPRKMQTSNLRQQADSLGFDIHDDIEEEQRDSENIEVFTDANARVPEVDNSEENPFVGPVTDASPPRRRSKRSRKCAQELEDEAQMEIAVARGEGMVYSYRGKKIFRPYENAATTTGVDSLRQRQLRRAVGSVTDRPLTRSQLAPTRLDFGAARSQSTTGSTQIDSEDDTEIDEPNTHGADVFDDLSTSFAARGAGEHCLAQESGRKMKGKAATDVSSTEVEQIEDERANHSLVSGSDRDQPKSGDTSDEHNLTNDSSDLHLGTEHVERVESKVTITFPPQFGTSDRNNASNPFNSWQRTKSVSRTSTSGRAKRGAETMEGSSSGVASKRTRSSERPA